MDGSHPSVRTLVWPHIHGWVPRSFGWMSDEWQGSGFILCNDLRKVDIVDTHESEDTKAARPHILALPLPFTEGCQLCASGLFFLSHEVPMRQASMPACHLCSSIPVPTGFSL